MHLRVTCPVCKTEYQVDSNLRGKRMRCPNLICRAVFEVDPSPTADAPVAETVPAPPPPAETPFQTAPTILAPPEPSAAPQPTAPKPRPPRKLKTPSPAPPLPPLPTLPTWATPPPVRNATAASPFEAPAPPESTESVGTSPTVRPVEPSEPEFPGDDDSAPPSTSAPPPKPRHRLSPLVIVGILAIALAGVGVAIAVRLWSRPGEIEKELVAQAETRYSHGDFDAAAKLYLELQRMYPESKDRYRLLGTLSGLRAELDDANDPAKLSSMHEHLDQFTTEFGADNERRTEIADLWANLANRLRDEARDASRRDLRELAGKSWDQVRRLKTPTAAQEKEFVGSLRDIDLKLRKKDDRAKLLTSLRNAAERFDVDRLRAAERRVKASEFQDDPDVVAALAGLRSTHKDAIRFRIEPDRPVAPADDLELIPLAASLVDGPTLEGPDGVFVLAPTGVLYALDPRRGELRWARRLGIDARRLPIRRGDGLVAILGDRKSIALLDAATGSLRWEHPLRSPCVTSPTLVGDRIFVPTIAGRLEVVDGNTGRGLGVFDIPQTLTEEAVLEPETMRLYIPGNVGYVYVLDIETNACVGLIETGHAADSLVEPIWFAKKAFVLTEATAGPKVRLRPVPIPGAVSAAKEFMVAGALSFPAWRDDGVLLLPTPPGKLTQVGRHLPGNADPLFFPLAPFETSAVDGPPGGALVLHADADNVWMLDEGRVQRLQRSFSAKTGPGSRVRWAAGVPLGEPLHAGQVHVPAAGLPTLFVPYRSGPVAAAAAIQGETGKILWRTELGSWPLGEIVPLDGGVGWATSGGVFVRDVAGKITYRREPPASHRVLLADGRSFGWSGRTVTWDGGAKSIELQAPVAGTPAIVGTVGIFPLATGGLARVDFMAAGVVTGPDWRRADAEPQVSATVTSLGDDVFLATDGGGSIFAVRWRDRKDWTEIGRVSVTSGRLVGAPLRLPSGRVIVREESNRLHRFDVEAGKPAKRRSWTVDGKIALGPYPLDDKFAIVTTENRLIVYDPERDEPIWEREFAAELIGPPRKIDDDVLVADVDGNLWLLDAGSGDSRATNGRGPVWSARLNLAPAVAPMPLPNGDLFVIWTDGTASVLSKITWRP